MISLIEVDINKRELKMSAFINEPEFYVYDDKDKFIYLGVCADGFVCVKRFTSLDDFDQFIRWLYKERQGIIRTPVPKIFRDAFD
jgi:hypothetical protein